jgi:hypothetical protein
MPFHGDPITEADEREQALSRAMTITKLPPRKPPKPKIYFQNGQWWLHIPVDIGQIDDYYREYHEQEFINWILSLNKIRVGETN